MRAVVGERAPRLLARLVSHVWYRRRLVGSKSILTRPVRGVTCGAALLLSVSITTLSTCAWCRMRGSAAAARRFASFAPSRAASALRPPPPAGIARIFCACGLCEFGDEIAPLVGRRGAVRRCGDRARVPRRGAGGVVCFL